MEKVENLYRTARVQNDSIDTPEEIGSRLRDASRGDRDVGAILRRAAQHGAI